MTQTTTQTQIQVPATVAPVQPLPSDPTFWQIIAIAVLIKSSILATAVLVKVIVK